MRRLKIEVKNKKNDKWVLLRKHFWTSREPFDIAYSAKLKILYIYGHPMLERFKSIPPENFRVNGDPVKDVFINRFIEA